MILMVLELQLVWICRPSILKHIWVDVRRKALNSLLLHPVPV